MIFKASMGKSPRTSTHDQSTLESTTPATMRHFQRSNHSEHLKQMFADYFVSKLFCDMTICCGGQYFEAHKLPLLISSPYFQNILQHDTRERPIVYLPDVTPEEVEFILEYCYLGRILLPENKLEGFLKACQLLQITSLFNESATSESEASITCTTHEQSHNNENATNNNSFEKSAVEAKSNKSPISKEDLNGQKKDIGQGPSSSHILDNPTEDSNILDSPPSFIPPKPQNINEPAAKSPQSSPESFVFSLTTSLPVNTKTQNQSVLFVTQTPDVLEISSEEVAGENILRNIQSDASKIDQDKSASEDITQMEEDLPSFTKLDNRPANASDSDDSEIIISKRSKKNTNSPIKQLTVVVHRVELKETNEDNNESLIAQQGSKEESPQLPKQKGEEEEYRPQFAEINFTTEVTDLKDVPENKVKFYCQFCRRCVKPCYLKRHRLKHKLLD